MNRMREIAGRPDRAVDYMLREIRHICRDMKKRDPGSEGEREAGTYMADALKRECGCSSVLLESFEEHPSAFYRYFYLSAFFDVFSWLGYWIHPAVSILSGSIALLLFVFQFCLYKQLIDPLFPQKIGTNVTAVRPCSGEVKQRIFLNGHIDAAWEFPLNYYFGGVVFEIPGVMALIGVLTDMVLSVCSLCGCAWSGRAFRFCAVFVPFFVLVAATYNPRRIVDGANDNLSGCYISIALLREMERNGIELEHTEVGALLTGSEEAGLRGAKAWGQKHKNDYTDVPTYILSFDTIHDPKLLAVNEKDLNGTVKADAGLCELFLQAAEETGLPCRRSWVPPFGGSTDSAAFTQAGFRSVGITGLNHKLENYYHTRKDDPDNLNREGLKNCLVITARLIEILEDAVVNGDGSH